MQYTEPRYTEDLDIWIEADEQNAVCVFRALAAFGAPLKGLTAEDFAKEGVFYQIGIPPARVDILMSSDGVTFSSAWPNRVASELGNQPVWFISQADLLRNKLASDISTCMMRNCFRHFDRKNEATRSHVLPARLTSTHLGQ